MHQLRGQKWSVYDEVWVTLDLFRVGLVIMDPVAIEGQRGVAEQVDAAGTTRDLPFGFETRLSPLSASWPGARRQKDDVLPLVDQSLAGLILDNSPERSEKERTGLAGLYLGARYVIARYVNSGVSWRDQAISPPAHMRRG